MLHDTVLCMVVLVLSAICIEDKITVIALLYECGTDNMIGLKIASIFFEDIIQDMLYKYFLH